jgi:histidinol-phosphatase (PHP family)
MIPCDLHIHPSYSIDAEPSIDRYCLRAEEIGLKVIGFSTHYDVNPLREVSDPFMIVDGVKVRVDDKTLGRYIDDCRKARVRYPGLRILIGLEVDYFPGVEADIFKKRSQFDFDYLIGSVHCIDGVLLSDSRDNVSGAVEDPLRKLADGYFDLLYQVADCGLFDVIGHADYYLRRGVEVYGPDIMEIHRQRLAKVVKAAVSTNTGFEINTSAPRHGGDIFYPHPDFLKQAIELGATINSIGSDSHAIDHPGEGINEALEMLDDFKIEFKPFYETD